MKKNMKKTVAAVMAAMTMVSTMATTSLAASDGHIGNTQISFWWGFKKVYVGDCNEDGIINSVDLIAIKSVSDKGWYWWSNAWAVYDCNQDGYVNDTDVQLMTDYLLG